jgi:C_GCAxxG_C_C family probable redox protein
MRLKLTLEEAKAKVKEHLMQNHCGPSVLKVMCEAYGLKNKDLLWAGAVFMGGIAGQQQAPCGAISGAAIALGLRHRCSLKDKDKVEKARKAAYDEAAEYVSSFQKRFGSITCIGLLGVDFNDEAAMKKARETGLFDGKCEKHVEFAIEKLYELEDKRNRSAGKKR